MAWMATYNLQWHGWKSQRMEGGGGDTRGTGTKNNLINTLYQTYSSCSKQSIKIVGSNHSHCVILLAFLHTNNAYQLCSKEIDLEAQTS